MSKKIKVAIDGRQLEFNEGTHAFAFFLKIQIEDVGEIVDITSYSSLKSELNIEKFRVTDIFSPSRDMKKEGYVFIFNIETV